MSKISILIIDDDPVLVQLLSLRLSDEGYLPLPAADGLDGIRQLYQQRPDLVILDVMMPYLDGWEVCRRIREMTNVPILMLTGRADLGDKIRGLSLGVDDYLTKPFDMDELALRVAAILRRSRPPLPTDNRTPILYDDGNLSVDEAKHEVLVHGRPANLTPLEFRLLTGLIIAGGEILSHDALLTQGWGRNYTGATPYVKVHIASLRRKIGDSARRPRYIFTVKGVGYYFRTKV